MTSPTIPVAGSVLDGESVKLLIEWDYLRDNIGQLRRFESLSSQPGRLFVKGAAGHDDLTHFTFIGRSDQDGWIEHDGGENPVPGLTVDVMHHGGALGHNEVSDDLDWSHSHWKADVCDDMDIVAFRPHREVSEGQVSFSQEAKIPTEQASEVADLLARLDYARGSRDRAHDRAQALYMTLAEVLEQVETYPLDDNTTCMCGSPIEGHNVGSGHAPVSQSDHAISLIVETIQKALGWSALPMGTVEGDCDVSASTCGTDGEAGSLPTPPTPPTTQERIASELPVVVRWSEKVNEWAVDLNDVCIETYADKADADDTARIIRRALLDHREER